MKYFIEYFKIKITVWYIFYILISILLLYFVYFWFEVIIVSELTSFTIHEYFEKSIKKEDSSKYRSIFYDHIYSAYQLPGIKDVLIKKNIKFFKIKNLKKKKMYIL